MTSDPHAVIEPWLSRLSDPPLLIGLAMVCAGTVFAAALIDHAHRPSSPGRAPHHSATERAGRQHMRVYYHRTPDSETDLHAAVETLAFAARWAPYGGAADDDVFVTFGLTPTQFVRRLHWAADYPGAIDHLTITPDELTQLRAHIARTGAQSLPPLDDTPPCPDHPNPHITQSFVHPSREGNS